MTKNEKERSWKPALRLGLGLALVIAIYSTVLSMAELYTNGVLELWVTLGVEWAALVWFLVRRAKAGNGFVRQLLEGSLAVVVLAAALVPPTWIQLTMISPDYGDVIVEKLRTDAAARGVPAERIEEMAERIRPMYTPVRQTTFMFVGTLMTCLPVVALVSVFARSRKSARGEGA